MLSPTRRVPRTQDRRHVIVTRQGWFCTGQAACSCGACGRQNCHGRHPRTRRRHRSRGGTTTSEPSCQGWRRAEPPGCGLRHTAQGTGSHTPKTAQRPRPRTVLGMLRHGRAAHTGTGTGGLWFVVCGVRPITWNGPTQASLRTSGAAARTEGPNAPAAHGKVLRGASQSTRGTTRRQGVRGLFGQDKGSFKH